MLRPQTALFTKATDTGNAGGGSPPAAAPAPTTETGAETPQTSSQPPPSTVKPGVIDSAISMFRDKGALTAEISTLKASNGKLTADLAAANAQLSTVTAERDNLQAGFKKLEAALAASNAENKDVQTEVTHQLASAGVPASGLPAGAPLPQTVAATGDDKIAELNKQIEATTCPKEKGRLANQVWDLMKASSSKIKVAAK